MNRPGFPGGWASWISAALIVAAMLLVVMPIGATVEPPVLMLACSTGAAGVPLAGLALRDAVRRRRFRNNASGEVARLTDGALDELRLRVLAYAQRTEPPAAIRQGDPAGEVSAPI